MRVLLGGPRHRSGAARSFLLVFAMATLLRVRTKDGTERLSAPAGATLRDLRALIEEKLGVPLAQQALAKSDPMGRQKGAALPTESDAQPLGDWGVIAAGLASAAAMVACAGLLWARRRRRQASALPQSTTSFEANGPPAIPLSKIGMQASITL